MEMRVVRPLSFRCIRCAVQIFHYDRFHIHCFSRYTMSCYISSRVGARTLLEVHCHNRSQRIRFYQVRQSILYMLVGWILHYFFHRSTPFQKYIPGRFLTVVRSTSLFEVSTSGRASVLRAAGSSVFKDVAWSPADLFRKRSLIFSTALEISESFKIYAIFTLRATSFLMGLIWSLNHHSGGRRSICPY